MHLPLLHLLPCALLGGPPTPYPTGVYSATDAGAYYLRRPAEVGARALEIGLRSSGFLSGLLIDKLSGEGASREDERAAALTELIVELGPTFIKIGQSASVRTDLLPPAYVKALTTLQEDVPAFSTREAREILKAELGDAASALLDGLAAEPIAAASLGQVYRATIDGADVAVKVQRPAITERIALDMHLVRSAGPVLGFFGVPGDLVGIADAWGSGLVAELDYTAEATNAARFNEQVQSDSVLSGQVFAPRVIEAASSRRVLTTEWIDGERLDQTKSPEDVPRLASLAMNAYMYMMLGSGSLHCDPHPGNLLRTADGKLCILDWGLVTELDADLRLTLIEHVAHIVAREYEKLPADLVRLGFVPAGAEVAAQDSGVVDLLAKTYSKRAEGGGFANFDVPALFDELRGLAADAGSSLFQIPPYFAYIAKAFATLEGIGLSADEDYSILNETLPYISRRMLSDPSPRTAGALQTFVFSEAKDDPTQRVLDADRVTTLLDGAQRYAASAASSSTAGTMVGTSTTSGEAAAGAGLEVRAEQAADAVLDFLREDSPASRLVTEQLVIVLAAASRNAWSDLRSRSGSLPPSSNGMSRSVLGTIVDPLGIFRASPLITNSVRDLAALDAITTLAPRAAELLSGGGPAASPSDAELQQLARALGAKAWARREDLREVSRRVAVEALDQAATRMNPV